MTSVMEARPNQGLAPADGGSGIATGLAEAVEYPCHACPQAPEEGVRTERVGGRPAHYLGTR